jgi:HSP20 family molecular chaperone IbpA
MSTNVNVQHEEGRMERTRGGQCYRPHVDILEAGDELVLVADMPGVKSDAIDINFEEGVLSIQGAVAPRYQDNVDFLLYEYGIGDFYRTFRVSEQVDASAIRAEFAAGVLTIHLPKAEQAKPRKIAVRAAG